MKERYKDWFFWVDWTLVVIILVQGIIYFDTLIRWKWGYWSIDLIPATILLVSWIIVRNKIIENRRWKWTKEQLHNLGEKRT